MTLQPLKQHLNMKTDEEVLKQKRQQFHRLLIALGEEKYKEVIVEGTFPGVESTTELNERQLDQLISDAERRLGQRGQPAKRKALSPAQFPSPHGEGAGGEVEIRKLRNRCLQVLSERGIKSTPKDWSAVNHELEADRYQWILSDEQRTQGLRNKRGIGTFNTPESLRKLFYQLCSIRDNELKIKTKVAEKAAQN